MGWFVDIILIVLFFVTGWLYGYNTALADTKAAKDKYRIDYVA